MKFSAKITLWYEDNKRDLPWRKTSDPYRVWLSEIILQQTRIDQGTDYYLRFVESFPDVASLAAAGEERILKHWQGLGYYSRARNLFKTASIIAGKYNGKFPDTYEEIIKLPGIGTYTAAAILSIAFQKPYPVVDGNVYRVISRLFGMREPIDSGKGKKVIHQKMQELMGGADPGTYNQAVMEFGAMHCTPMNPGCTACIFKAECVALASGEVENFPVRKPRPVQRYRYFNYFLFLIRGNDSVKIMINKRKGNDIWKNLYDFPLIETETKQSLRKLQAMVEAAMNLKNKTLRIMGNEYKHILSHQVIMARFIQVEMTEKELSTIQKNLRFEDLIPIEIRDLAQYPVPRLIDKFLEENRLDESSGE